MILSMFITIPHIPTYTWSSPGQEQQFVKISAGTPQSSPVESSEASNIPQSTAANQRLIVALLGAAAFIVSADVRVVNPLLHVIASEFKTDIGSVGYIATAYAIPYGLFQLVYGPLGDRIGKVRVMTIAMAFFAFGTAACGLMPNLLLLDALRFVTGATAAAIIPLSIAYIGDHVAYEERQPALAKFLGAIALGQILSTSMSGIVADFLSWRYIFLCYGLISVIIFSLMWYSTRNIVEISAESIAHRMTGRETIKQYFDIVKTPLPALVLSAVCIEGFFYFGAYTYIGAFLRDSYHLLYIVIGLILSGYGIGMLLYSRFARVLLHRLGESGMLLSGGVITMLCYFAFAYIHSWIAFTLFHIVLGMCFNMIHNTFQTKATEMYPQARGTAVSLFSFSLFIGQGIGAAALGVIVDGPGYVPMFVLAGIAMLGLVTGYVLMNRRIARLVIHSS